MAYHYTAHMQSCLIAIHCCLNTTGYLFLIYFLHLCNCVHNIIIFQCSEEVGISWTDVDSCMKSVSGTALQLLAQQETLKVAPSGLGFVPTITFNKVRGKKNMVTACS
jgi:hypothetical protein